MESKSMYHEEECGEKCEEVAFLSRKILDLNKQLIESEKAKSRFLSLVASELNNPMTALLGLIPRLAPQNDERLEAIHSLVHEEALILDFRIQNLVAAAEIESGEQNITKALIDPVELVNEAAEALKYPLKAKNIQLVINNTLEKKIVTDPQKLYLILKNILANGCCYGRNDEKLEVGIHENGTTVFMTVKNRGEGPNVEYKPQIFTRFAHGPDGGHGLGIGLSIVRELCERLGGSIDYASGEDTVTFTVTLPLETLLPTSEACGSNEFLFESFDGAIEL